MPADLVAAAMRRYEYNVFYNPIYGWHGAGVIDCRTGQVLAAVNAATWFDSYPWGACFGEAVMERVDGRTVSVYATTDLFAAPARACLTYDVRLLEQARAAYSRDPGVRERGSYRPHTGPLLDWNGRRWLAVSVTHVEADTEHFCGVSASWISIWLAEMIDPAEAPARGLTPFRRGYRELVAEALAPGTLIDWARPGRPSQTLVVSGLRKQLCSPYYLEPSHSPPRVARPAPPPRTPLLRLEQMPLF